MTLRNFIKENREQLDQAIRVAMDRPEARLNDDDREDWIRNDESLYNWARAEGVKL